MERMFVVPRDGNACWLEITFGDFTTSHTLAFWNVSDGTDFLSCTVISMRREDKRLTTWVDNGERRFAVIFIKVHVDDETLWELLSDGIEECIGWLEKLVFTLDSGKELHIELESFE